MSTSNYNVDYAADTCSPLTPYILHSLHTLYNTNDNTYNNSTTTSSRDCSELLTEFQLRNSRTIANRKGNNATTNNATTNNATTNNIATNGSNLQAYMKVSGQEKGYRTFYTILYHFILFYKGNIYNMKRFSLLRGFACGI